MNVLILNQVENILAKGEIAHYAKDASKTCLHGVERVKREDIFFMKSFILQRITFTVL